MFFWIMTVGLFFIQFTAGVWLHVAFPSVPLKWAALIIPFLLSVFVRFGMTYTRTHFGVWESVLYYVANAWVGLAFIIFCASLIFLALHGLLLLCRCNIIRFLGPASLVIMVVLCALAMWNGLKTPAIKYVDVHIDGAPELKAAVLSDTHLGVGVSLKRFERALEKLQKEKPDLLLVLGDVFEYGPGKDSYAQALARFEAPLGKYGVLGNHEYYTGYENSLRFYRQSGIALLQNETARPMENLTIAGVKDVRTARVKEQDVTQLLASIPAGDAIFYLSHQPLLVQTAADAGAGLMLSGHTHNGQIFPFNFLVKWQYPYVYGLYPVGHMNLYVTSGWFYWGMPLRLFAPAEMAVIRVNA